MLYRYYKLLYIHLLSCNLKTCIFLLNDATFCYKLLRIIYLIYNYIGDNVLKNIYNYAIFHDFYFKIFNFNLKHIETEYKVNYITLL